jgi:tetratricopeptide (TPR) repeat protein
MKKKYLIIAAVLVVLFIIFLILMAPVSRFQNEKGLNYYDSTDYAIAENYFQKAVYWNGKNAGARINLIKSQLEQGKNDPAKENLMKLKKKFPDLAETSGLDGKILVTEKEYQKGIEALSLALEKDSTMAYAYFYRAVAYANQGDLESSAKDYLKLQGLDQANVKALKEGAVVFAELENFRAAIQNYDLVLEQQPSNANAFVERGSFKMKIGDHAGAVSDFDKAINLNPNLPEAYLNRGKSLAQSGNYDKAIEDFKVADANHYKTAGAKFNIGLASLKKNDLKTAREYLEASMKEDTEKEYLAGSCHLLGVINMMQGNHAKALDYFNRSLQQDDTSSDVYFNRGIAYSTMKEYKKALADLLKCEEMGKTSADVYFALGVQYINLSDNPKGCANLKKAAGMGHAGAAEMIMMYCQ